MSEVFAVKLDHQRQQIERLLLENQQIYYDVWKVGVNVGLRISDLLALTMEQAKHVVTTGDSLRIREGKTKNHWDVSFNSGAVEILKRRLKENPDDTYLFQSHSRKNRSRNRHKPNPISRRAVGRVFEHTGKAISPPVVLGTHSMRKTRGFTLHKAGMPIEQISKSLGHSNHLVTMAYIGIDQESIRRSFMDYVI